MILMLYLDSIQSRLNQNMQKLDMKWNITLKKQEEEKEQMIASMDDEIKQRNRDIDELNVSKSDVNDMMIMI